MRSNIGWLVILAFTGVICLQITATKIKSHETPKITNNRKDITSILERLEKLEIKTQKQDDRIHKLEETIDAQRDIIRKQDDRIQLLEKVKPRAVHAAENKSTTNTSTTSRSKLFKKETARPERRSTFETAHFASFGCIDDIISLSCPNERTIDVTGAYFGEYFYAPNCGDACCPPHPVDDCTEYVPVSKPADWEGLKQTCNTETTCEYQYRGSTFAHNCTLGNAAEYMEVYYNCLPEDSETPVAFTAYSGKTQTYTAGQHYLFHEIISNYGFNYQPESSFFICPKDGIYMFFISILTEVEYDAYGNIMVEKVSLVTAYSHPLSSYRGQASILAISECMRGQKAWVQEPYGGVTHDDGSRYVTFSGYLLDVFV